MEPEKKAPDVKPKKSIMNEPSIRGDGTRLFRMMNFELFAAPTPRMRMLSVAGSGLFVGILGYFTFFADRPQPQQLQRKQWD